MAAFLDKAFKRGFLLDEENLTKISNILTQRTQDLPNAPTIGYKIYRSDGLIIDSDNLSDVVNEDNSKHNKIHELHIDMEHNLCRVHLLFTKENGALFRVEADERDRAFLISSDIKEYLNAEVLTLRTFSFDKALTSRVILPFFVGLTMAFAVISPLLERSPNYAAAGLKTRDLGTKLDYLIKIHQSRDAALTPSYYVFIPVVIALAAILISSPLDKLFPRNVFLWGREVGRYAKVKSWQEKLIWGVGIAFVLSILSAFVFEWIK